MDTKQIQQARKALADETQRLWSLVRSLRATGLDVPETANINDLSSYDQHPADHGSETFEREKDLGLLLDTCQQLEQVKKAKERLARGEYGLCEQCGWPIDAERLAALPAASLCVSCKQQVEKAQDNYHRPVEEEVLSPPFARSYHKGGPGFDGEDAWQAVAKHGAANTPQDMPDGANPDDDEGLVESTDGLIDLDYRQVTDQDEIYPDLQGDLLRRPPAPEANEIDMELWEYIQNEFPGNPEMELAAELTTKQMEELAREYAESEWQDMIGRK